jgi:hypothetical protein
MEQREPANEISVATHSKEEDEEVSGNVSDEDDELVRHSKKKLPGNRGFQTDQTSEDQLEFIYSQDENPIFVELIRLIFVEAGVDCVRNIYNNVDVLCSKNLTNNNH